MADRPPGLLREAASQFILDHCPRLAAALSYYTLLSLAPMLYLVLLLTSWAYGTDNARAALVHEAEANLGPDVAAVVAGAMDAASGLDGGLLSGLLGLGLVLVAATTVFAELQGALNQVWGLQAPKGKGLVRIVRERVLSLSVVLALASALLVSMALQAILSTVTASATFAGAALLLRALELVASIGLLTVLLAAVYKVLPDAVVEWRDVWWGAALTATLLSAGKFLIGTYLSLRPPGSAFGAAGSLVLLMAWVYFGSLVFFFGAEVTEIRAARKGTIRARRGAIRVEPLRVPLETPRHPEPLPAAEPEAEAEGEDAPKGERAKARKKGRKAKRGAAQRRAG